MGRLKTSLGIWAFGSMVTRFMPVGYQPQLTNATTAEKVHRAVTGLGDLIERLPHGLDTYVHERGTSLSAGERQLIALARTFLARPRVVVLCTGAEAATYRTDLFSPYHGDRPPVPDELAPQWLDAPAFFGAFGWLWEDAGDL